MKTSFIRDAWWRVGADARQVGAAWFERWAWDVAEAVADPKPARSVVRVVAAAPWLVGSIAWTVAGDAIVRVCEP